jgi:lysophospholipase L1-like esterase
MNVIAAILSWSPRVSAAVVILGVASAHAQTTPAAAAAAPVPAAAPTDTASKAAIPTIFVCGDSTAKNNGAGAQGWGTAIAAYFDKEKVKISNVAHAGTSSHTYYNGDWPKVLPQIKAGDYVLEVFGINDGTTPNGTGDETKDVPGKGGQMESGVHTYGWYMSKMATDALAKGAHVYLLTLTVRNVWTNPLVKFKDATPTGPLPANYDPKQDKIVRNDMHANWTLEVGKKLNVPVLDLHTLEGDRYEQLGREKVMVNYLDHNHTNPTGAELIAGYIVAGLKAFPNSPFIPMLSAMGQAWPTADAKYVFPNTASDTAGAKAGSAPAAASANAAAAATKNS